MINTESNNDIKYKNEFIICHSHQSKLAKKYCNKCQTFICNTCAIDDHSDHLEKITKLNSMYLGNKEILTKFLNLTSSEGSFKQTSITFKCMNFIFHEAKNFCKDCKKFICQKCSATHFPGIHQIIPINEYFSHINGKVEFFLQLMKNFENWQRDIRNSRVACEFSKLTEVLDDKIFETIFNKIHKLKLNLNDLLNKRKNLVLSVLNDLNKFFVKKNNILVKNKKKMEDMENLFKKIKLEKDIVKVYENFIEFENFLESLIPEKEKSKFQNLILNLNTLDEHLEKYSRELLNGIHEDCLRPLDEDVINKFENVIRENQNRFENQVRNSLKLSKEDFEKMSEAKEKISEYFSEEELNFANSRLLPETQKKQELPIITTEIPLENEIHIININRTDDQQIPKEINNPSPIAEIKNNWSHLEPSLEQDLFIINSSRPVVERIVEVKEVLSPTSFKEISIYKNFVLSILSNKQEIDLNIKEENDNNKNDKSPIFITIEDASSQPNIPINENPKNIQEEFRKENEALSSRNQEIKEIQIHENTSNITEEKLDDAFSADESDSASQELPNENKVCFPSANEEANQNINTEKRKTIDSEISKININVDDSNTVRLNPNAKESKESEVITFDNEENSTIKEDQKEETVQEIDPYLNLSFSEKIEVAKKKIQDIRENINANSDYVEINQDGIEIDKKKLTDITINQLLEKIFTWNERNQLELMSIGHHIKTIFVYNPIVDRIKEIEFTQKFPTFHSYLNILPWVYISGGKDFETNQENNNFFKIRRESEKTFELINLAPMKSKRSSHIMINHSKTNSIYVLSGSRNYTCERYDITFDTWDILPSLNSSREKASACIFSGTEEFLYVFSGFDRTINKCINTVERLSLSKNNSKWEFIQIKGIQNLLKRQAFSCLYINNTHQDYSNQDSLLNDSNQIYLLGGINLLKNETKDVLFFNLKTNTIANHSKLVMNENFAFNHSQFVNIPCYDPDLFYNFSENFSVVILDSKNKNFRSRKLDFF